MTNGLGKLQPVHAPRHIDVGEDDLNVLPGFEERDGLISAASLQRIEACFFQKEDCTLTDQEIILNMRTNDGDINDTEMRETVTKASQGERGGKSRR